jgi:hypothetical protein
MKRPPDRKRLAAALVLALAAAACLLPRLAPGAAEAAGAGPLLGAMAEKGG